MQIAINLKKSTNYLKKFLDFDKQGNNFYNNLYLDDYKIVIKMPLMEKESPFKEIKIEKFNLTKYTFLLSYG